MKVAIIGANGQLGTDLAEVFGEEAIPLTHKDLDVTDFESLKILKELKPEVIINTAAYVRVDDAELYPEKAFQVNTIGALNVARIANEIDAVNVYISTDYVFDGTKGEPYTEEDAPNPLNVYGLSKYAGEIFTRNYSKKYYIIRVASLYGKAGASGKGGNFVEFMIQKAKRGEEIRVVDNMFMSPTYTKDVARMLKKFLELKPRFGIYHVVNEGYCSWYEFTRAIFEILGWDVEVKPIKSSELRRLAKRPMFSALKNEKLEKLGLRMRHWREALGEYLKEKGYL
ncbi:MAG: dTDP-4-dehydrorhamnose reductase [Thermococcus sp.]|uniref:dTDP-4-dehydrorhamnose reductase n=1 Tax=Thermococcus sp. TaxID=35749 RepID=UPI001DB69044|nr:dTDP-4-dehydrorhamnose reductase [Thermococcus sp.]MBO8175046.1 dTDP-4-dehydrorhamnose reductase [Thermococcus sp.]